MHKESVIYMREAFARHAAGLTPGRVLDVGAIGKRAYFRDIWQQGGWDYTGCDLVAGPNVDTVLDDPWRFPFAADSFDAVVSGQMLEHNEFFWLSFVEMARVLRPGGLMIHIAPSRGVEHRAPQDCWRFYRDGMAALAKWSGMELVESTTDWADEHFDYYAQNRPSRVAGLQRTLRQRGTVWGDTVGVFRKVLPVEDSPAAHYIRGFAATLGPARAALATAAE